MSRMNAIREQVDFFQTNRLVLDAGTIGHLKKDGFLWKVNMISMEP